MLVVHGGKSRDFCSAVAASGSVRARLAGSLKADSEMNSSESTTAGAFVVGGALSRLRFRALADICNSSRVRSETDDVPGAPDSVAADCTADVGGCGNPLKAEIDEL